MLLTTREKVERLLRLKNKPTLELFKVLQEFERDSEKAIEKIKKEITSSVKQVLEEEIKQFKTQISGLVEQAVQEQVFKGISQIKGDTGDPGYTPIKGKDYWTNQEINEIVTRIQSQIRIPEDGRPGRDAITPVAGVDYPTRGQIRTIVKAMVSAIPVPKNGRTPEKGIDYFTDKDINEIIKQIKTQFPRIELKAEEIRDKLQSLRGEKRLDASAIKNLSKFLGQAKRTLHRGGIALEWESLTLSADGSSATLTYAPYSSSTVMIFLNGSLLTQTTNYTISTRTITFLQPTPGGEAWAFYRKA